MNALDIVPLAPIAVPRRSLALGTYTFEIDTGIVIVGSDPHWTISQPTTTATKALVQLTARFAEEGSLRAIILAGDLPDFGQISRHTPLGWERHGSLAEELKIVNERLGEIKAVAGLGTQLVRVKGNHCARYDARLAAVAPEFAGVRGFSLDEQLDPDWQPCMVCEINPGPFGLIVKHRHRGGANAAHGNATAAGKCIATGHTHQPNVVRLSNAATGSFWASISGRWRTWVRPRSPIRREQPQRAWPAGLPRSGSSRGSTDVCSGPRSSMSMIPTWSRSEASY